MRFVLSLVALSWLVAPAAALAQSKAKPVRVAILYFDYDGKDEELGHLRKGLTSMLISDLSDVDGIQLVERTDLEKVIGELKLQKQRFFDKKTTARIGKLLGAQVLVTGRYFEFRGKLLVNAKMVEVETGEVKGVRSARPTAEFIDLEQELAGRLSEALKGRVGKRTPAKRTRRRKAKPPKRLPARTAARYGRALEAIDRGNKKKAKKILSKVVKERPDFALAKRDLISLAR
ncbi:MAG: CsgG/HfaB family protein [Deltaproteobacteria bacterium]|jgi:TolB-like protein|nr:CsgG/HfaB family protein [Deltaproteobacteria bacterium]